MLSISASPAPPEPMSLEKEGTAGKSAVPQSIFWLRRDTEKKRLVELDFDTRLGEDESLEPPCRVFLHNDDVTPIEYVPVVLRDVFSIGVARALWITVKAHALGFAEIVVEPCRKASAHVDEAHARARADGHDHFRLSSEPID